MSHKSAAFRFTMPQPQTPDKYFVFIPGLLSSPFRICNTSIPFPERRDSKIEFAGASISLPTVRVFGNNTWTCEVYEDVFACIYNKLKECATAASNSVTSTNFPDDLRRKVAAKVSLSAAKTAALSNGVTENFTSPLDRFDNHGETGTSWDKVVNRFYDIQILCYTDLYNVPIPTVLTTLTGCWLQSVRALQLASNDPTKPQLYSFTFKYQTIV